MPDGRQTTFCVGRFLNEIAEYYLCGQDAKLGEPGAQLRALPWFEKWLESLRDRRAQRTFAWRPTVDAALQHVLHVYASTAHDARPPDRSACFAVNVAPGQCVSVPLAKWMARFAEARGRGELDAETRAHLEAQPWAAEWLAELSESRAAAARRRVLTKTLKIELLLLHCFHTRPTKAFVIPVCGHGIDGVYRWRPHAWLDDVVDNWLRPERANVRLDAMQMAVLEKLPWSKDWIEGVRSARGRRAAVRVARKASRA